MVHKKIEGILVINSVFCFSIIYIIYKMNNNRDKYESPPEILKADKACQTDPIEESIIPMDVEIITEVVCLPNNCETDKNKSYINCDTGHPISSFTTLGNWLWRGRNETQRATIDPDDVKSI